MDKCDIIVDSACDLPLELLEKETVGIIHLRYTLDGVARDDDLFQTYTPHEFYERLRNGSTSSTSQASLVEVREVLENAIVGGRPTVYMSFSGALSSHYSTVETIYDELCGQYPDNSLRIVDTKLESTPEALLLLEAFRQRDAGLTPDELVAWVDEAANFVNTMFIVDDLEALHRGGRIPRGVAVAGGKLNVKPVLSTGLRGDLTLTGAVKGRKKAVKQMAAFYRDNIGDDGMTAVTIGHGDNREEAERLRDEILKATPNANVFIHDIGLTIGSHTGAGILAMSFWGPDRREHAGIGDKIANLIRNH